MLTGDKRRQIKFEVKNVRLPVDLCEILEENARLVARHQPTERSWSFSDSIRHFLGLQFFNLGAYYQGVSSLVAVSATRTLSTKILARDKRKNGKLAAKTIRLPVDLASVLEDHLIEHDRSFSDTIRYFLGVARPKIEHSNHMMKHFLKLRAKAAAADARKASRHAHSTA